MHVSNYLAELTLASHPFCPQAAERGRRIRHNYDQMRSRTVAQEIKKGNTRLNKNMLKHLDLANDVQNWDAAVRVRVSKGSQLGRLHG